MGQYHRVKFTNVDASPRQMVTAVDDVVKLVGFAVDNPNTSDVYVKFYDESSGNCTVGTTPTHMGARRIPADSEVVLFEGTESRPMMNFNDYLTVACTTEQADSGTTSPTSDVTVELFYYTLT